MDRSPRLLRCLLGWVLALAVGVVAGCAEISPSGFSGDVQVLLTRGEAYATTLARRSATALTDEEVLVLGYLERARRGLGSPFRTIDYALRDPDLRPPVRERVAYAILARALSGRIYEQDASVLEGVRFFGVDGARPVGRAQLALIERAIASAPTPASGERTVRLAFRIATAERTVFGAPSSLLAHLTALVADRRRATEDARALLRTATRTGEDPLVLLQRWRRELHFQVERPALSPLTVQEEVAIAEDAPQLARALRALAMRLSAPDSWVDRTGSAPGAASATLLPPEVAQRLLALAERRNYPRQAPVAVAVMIGRDEFVGQADLRPEERGRRERFAEAAWNEERLVAAAGVLRGTSAARGVRLPAIELQAAGFLRAWNQEEPWFPGDAAPTARDVAARFGLAGLEFDPEVPEAWRPYYLRMLARGIVDFQRVIPTATLRGLSVRVGPLPAESRALALHEPRTRTLYLPPATGAGTLAHEIAHDLDWQLARRKYDRRGGYATDLAVRRQHRDRIAISLTGLAASLQPLRSDALSGHDTRPAEVFARGTDWFVATALAREGRAGGYLTSFQDDALTGYGTTRGPDVGGGAAPALLSILQAIAPLDDETRQWAIDTYGPARILTPSELAAAILNAGRELDSEARLMAIAQAAERSLSTLSSPSCRIGSAGEMRRLVTAQRQLVQQVRTAAVRGAAIDAVRLLARDNLTGERGVVDHWLAWRLYGAPEPVDSAVAALAPAFEDILYRAEAAVQVESDLVGSAFQAGSVPGLCGRNPFPSSPPAPVSPAAAGGIRAPWPAPAIGAGVDAHPPTFPFSPPR